MSLKIMLVDDCAAIRRAVQRRISTHTDMEVVGHAENGRVAVELAAKLNPDMIIMDVSMPEISGLEATRLIKAENPNVKIIGYSSFQPSDCAAAMLDAGASSFVCKDCPPEELLSAMQEVQQGDALGVAPIGQ